ncbi:hypothetical protein V2A60_008191 [Cordyceps javanica]|uniref:Uncharacterized protein n=1 Tax=Cordyceps javanica TaxID=43265 RepID=A0A545UNF4_9HYPO|nr:hypothetical protein IF1G_10233 [Cordyceps javanica]TQW02743.1 hypothetical protein IF2G_09625 [Cordyceps javanica]
MKSIIFALAWAASLAKAVITPDASNGNLTIALFADSQGDACSANDISNAISLTTSSLPVSFTCFNVGDIFSQSNTSTEFTNGSANYHDDGDQRNGVAWRLQNQHLYDAKANYSRVWYAQANASRIEPGKDGSWVFYTYALPNCEQLAKERPSKPDEHPWYETSCQTGRDGQCRSTPGAIVSFGINTAASYNPSHGGCATWAKQGMAPSSRRGAGIKALTLVGVVALWLIS